MEWIEKNAKGILVCLAIAVPSHFLGQWFPVVGGAVFAIVIGMVASSWLTKITGLAPGIRFTSKKILQYAVILLGFGMNLSVVMETGKQSLPIILTTISTSLLIAFVLYKVFDLSPNSTTLIGVGSSICGGSAIAATAPVIGADEEEVAQAISVIFFFNVLAALTFPALGGALGFDTHSGEAFGVFAGTAVNDTSSVTAAASTWDNLYQLGSQTLDKAVTVKLTRTLAIIPITLGLAFLRTRREKTEKGQAVAKAAPFPTFILFFILASLLTTLAVHFGLPMAFFQPFKALSKFFIIMAMAAIGLNTNLVKLVKNGGAPILVGLACWLGITSMTLLLQYWLHIW